MPDLLGGGDDAHDNGDDMADVISTLSTPSIERQVGSLSTSYVESKAIKFFQDSSLGWLVGLGISAQDAVKIVETYSEGKHPPDVPV